MDVTLCAKVLGSGLVLGAGALAGYTAAKATEERLKELERLEICLINLSTEISYFLSPLPKALVKAGQKSGGEAGRLFVEMGNLVGMGRRKTPDEALEEALVSIREDSIPRFGLETLRDLAKNLGGTGHREQIRYIEGSIERLKDHRRLFEEESRKKARLYRYLGLLGALSTVIVLI
ncbi:MAG: stage III sporulation protein AB [Candidatus Fermentithermobacillus carboniphilus]|uniref:Stage III sporulation protein AB n=1 Tax=Candidatus Fermentithermobacillus carboniphilus TaxID=3085328 RepID=A0AAT9LCW4_9FIRM|nr:MAG: stage III sporulation protein AB [Candidatus Fermentithermobacillus carboniphilus]